jgi:homoserine kinase type II
MDVSNLLHLLTGWPIEPPFLLTLLPGSTNNQAWSVKSADQSSYVLRLTPGVPDLPRIRYEVALLLASGEKSLPFSLPICLQTRSRERFLLVEQGDAEPAIATLMFLLPGSVPERDVVSSVSVGVALAQLDAALATIAPSLLPVSSGFSYGDLYHIHPLVPDPFSTVEQLLETAQSRQIDRILRQAQQDWEVLSAQSLPRQILHRDCGPGNVLMEQECVTAILDFEFAGMDLRIFDLCVAMSWWPVRLMGTGREWELIDAFGRAYTANLPLTEDELLALPAALRMRDATSLVHRIGRYLAGLETAQTLQERVQHSLWREAWLVANQEILVQHALAWSR